MTSFRLIQIDHSVANMSCHSATLRYGPSPMERQKSSSDVSTRQATLTDHQTAWEMGHNTKRCSQSSKVAPHNAQSPEESGTMRCRKDLFINRWQRRSQTKIQAIHTSQRRSRHQPLAEKESDEDPIFIILRIKIFWFFWDIKITYT